MASMNNCENIANQIASKLKTTIKTKSAGEPTGMAWCNGTLANNLTYRVLNSDASNTNGIKTDASYDVTISNNNITVQLSTPASYTANNVAGRAANAWNGAQTT